MNNPTPRRKAALRNWAIDADKLSQEKNASALSRKVAKILRHRKNMPQVKDSKKIPCKTKKEVVNPQVLRPSQKSFNAKKVANIKKELNEGTLEFKPIIISKDNYILDGHHRWKASLGLWKKVPVIRIPKDRKEALDYLKKKVEGHKKQASMEVSRAKMKNPHTGKQHLSSIIADKPWYRRGKAESYKPLVSETFYEAKPEKLDRLSTLSSKLNKNPDAEGSEDLLKEYQKGMLNIYQEGPSATAQYLRTKPLLFGKGKFNEMAENPRKFMTFVPKGESKDFVRNAEMGFSKDESPRSKWKRYKPHTKKPVRIISDKANSLNQ